MPTMQAYDVEQVEATLTELRALGRVDFYLEEAQSSFTCEWCGQITTIDTDEISPVMVYNVGDLISDLESHCSSFFAVGEGQVETFARNNTCEYEAYACDHCGGPHDADDLSDSRKRVFRCPNCSEFWDGPHEALMCCSPSCTQESDCHCLRGSNLMGRGPNEAVPCNCGDGCPWWLCSTCHARFSTGDVCRTHIFAEHQVDNGDVESKAPVGGPTNLPPAVVYSEVERDPECAICASEFCCTVHGQHRHPHRGCVNAV